MEQCRRILAFQCASDLCNRQNRAHLVIDQHAGHQNGILTHGVFHIFGQNVAVRGRLDVSDLKAFAFQSAAGVQGRCVLDGRGHDMPSGMAIFACRTENRGIDALSTARSKVRLGRRAAQDSCDGFPAVLEHPCSLNAHFMQGRRIAKFLAHHVHRCLGSRRQHTRGGGVVQIVYHLIGTS